MTLLPVRALTKEKLALGVAVLFGCFSLAVIHKWMKRGLGIMKVAAGVTPVFALVYSQRAAIITGVIFAAPAIWMSISAEIRRNSYFDRDEEFASEVVDYLDRTVH